VVEIISSTPLCVLKSDTKEEVLNFLKGIPEDIKKKIVEIGIDMKAGYRNAIKEVFGPSFSFAVDPF